MGKPLNSVLSFSYRATFSFLSTSIKRLLQIFLFLPAYCFSQSVSPATVNVTGGSYQAGAYHFEWSIGEMTAVETLFGNGSLVVTSGVLQPGTSTVTSTSFVANFLSDEVKIMPNPTKDWLEVNLLTKMRGRVIMTIMAIGGNKLITKQFDYNGTGTIQRFNLSAFAAGQYWLIIELQPPSGGTSKKGSFKVNKIN